MSSAVAKSTETGKSLAESSVTVNTKSVVPGKLPSASVTSSIDSHAVSSFVMVPSPCPSDIEAFC